MTEERVRFVIILLLVVLALLVGAYAGYRARISEEEVFVYPNRMLPPVPPDLALVSEIEPGSFATDPPMDELPTISAPVAPPEAVTRRPKAGPEAVQRRSRQAGDLIRVRGIASWHATGRSGLFAAAGPALRRALGKGWRGTQVIVSSRTSRRIVAVTLNDYCPCGEKSKRPDKLLDFSDEAFRALAPLSTGVVKVVVEGFR